MPINQSMMNSIKKQYGAKKAKAIYYAIEAKNKAADKKKSKSKGKK